MPLTDNEIEFITAHPSAAMVSIGTDGWPKPVRVGVAMVDGQLWSSGTQDRVRTGRLRRNPRCSLFIWDEGFRWLAVQATVAILDGPGAAEQNLRLFRVMQKRPTGPLSWFGGDLEAPRFLEEMAREGRLIYQFEDIRTYGLDGSN